MAVQVAGQVGPQTASDATFPTLRLGKTAEIIVQELHGRFYEQNYRGNVYSIGCGFTALSATTITLSATSTPILGVWNPTTSTVNLVILQISLATAANAGTGAVTGPGAFLLASSLNNSAISTGSAPFNRKTLASSGSQAKAFPGGVALTGLTNNVVVFEGLGELPLVGGFATGTIAAGTTDPSQYKGFSGVVNFDGGLIVPPGGVLSLINTTSTTTYSVAGRLMWEEVSL